MIILLLVGLLAAGFRVSEAQSKTITKCRETGDVVFALDGSESIKSKNFPKLKEFSTKIVDSFEISQDKIQVGAMVYSTLVRDYFGPMDSVANIKSNISAFSYPKNTSRADLALAYMRQRLLKTQRARVGVIISDGDSKYPDLTKSEAEGARNEGINLIAIGVGSEPEEEVELENIGGSKAMYRVVKNFDDLVTDATIQDIQTLICNVLKTARKEPAPVVQDEIVIDPLCDGCIIANGFGYNAYKEDCSKFVQCYPSQDSKGLKVMTSAVKQCAYKTFWSQDDLTCVNQEDTECEYSICDGQPDGTTYSYLGCRTYWNCAKGLPEAKCCAAGHHYDNTKGACVVGIPSGCSGVDCGEEVGARKKKLRLCEFEGHRSDPTKYNQILQISPSKSIKLLRSCAPGTIFDERQCSCIFDINGISKSTDCDPLVSQETMSYGKTRNVEVSSSGDVITFKHKDHINIWRLANHEFQDTLGVTFSVKLKPYTSRTGSEREQIMINCLHSDHVMEGDDCSASISIQVKKFYGYYTFKGELHTIDIATGRNSSRVLYITVRNTSGYNGYVDVVFAYDGQNFAMKVDGSESSTRLSGWVQRRQTGFIFGRPMLVKGPIQFLDGSIREIEIFDCISDGIRDALRVM